ncbi:ferredoxin [Halobacteriales archaeon QS_8_69_73]|nr:MAG: ferredoxin [Halobacteriales archaeon QS_8_69_73]
MSSPFEVLHVDPDADDAELKRAYRRRAKEAHPDRGGSVEEFRRVKAAYETIRSGEADLPDVDGSGPDADADTDGPRTAGATPDADAGAGADSDPGPGAEVEYLNFEVFDDYGWSLADDDLFERAAGADLGATDHGRFRVEPDETLLAAAERRGFAWPFACRGGACANCAVVLVEGELSTPVDHILPAEMVDRGVRLSCVGEPLTEELSIVFNVKHMPDLEELRLPPRPFERARTD